ncbi:MAG: hypothetical protein M0R77_16610 [Gammaproteobacteria bacterium]|nr:hypothetical protein [Gammaproteobacteria bacterium]
MKIVLSSNHTAEQFVRFARIWNDEVFARVELAGELSEADLEQLTARAIALKPDDFADVVLELIASSPAATADVLHRIYRHGDQGAREALCEREDLDADLRAACARAMQTA